MIVQMSAGNAALEPLSSGPPRRLFSLQQETPSTMLSFLSTISEMAKPYHILQGGQSRCSRLVNPTTMENARVRSASAHFRREAQVVDNLKPKMLVGMNIIVLECMTVDLENSTRPAGPSCIFSITHRGKDGVATGFKNSYSQ